MHSRFWPAMTLPIQEGPLLEEVRPNWLKVAKLQQSSANSANKYALSMLAWNVHVNKYSKVNGN